MKVDPEGAGFDPGRLERITEHFERPYVATGKIPGCQVAVSRGGKVAYWRSLGLMDRERSKPVEDDTIWRIYSMTKPITSLALMQLYELGHFQLTDPLHRYIPEWRGLKVGELQSDGSITMVEQVRPVSVRDALTHMTGLAGSLVPGHPTDDRFTAALRANRKGMTLEGVCSLLADYPLKFQPGSHWNYGLSTDVCARLVEILSGERFDHYLQANVFEPLGMVDTGFSVGRCLVPPLRRLLRLPARRVARPAGRSRAQPIPPAPLLPVRFRRPRLDLGRLPPLLPDVAQWRRARRSANPRPQDARPHDLQPPPE